MKLGLQGELKKKKKGEIKQSKTGTKCPGPSQDAATNKATSDAKGGSFRTAQKKVIKEPEQWKAKTFMSKVLPTPSLIDQQETSQLPISSFAKCRAPSCSFSGQAFLQLQTLAHYNIIPRLLYSKYSATLNNTTAFMSQ